MSVVIWLTFGASLVLAFALGMAVRVQREVDRRVDVVLRRETRFRHPATEAGRHHIAESASVPTDEGHRNRVTRIVDEALSGVDKRAERAASWTGEAPDRKVVCGKPAETNLGTVACLGEPGHKGGC